MTASRHPKNALTEMFEKACLNLVFGDPQNVSRDKTNIPVHIRPTKQQNFSYAFIEPGPGVFDPANLSSNQLLVNMTQKSDTKAVLDFTGDHFDSAQFQIIANEIAGDPDIRVTAFDGKTGYYALEIENFDQAKLDKIVRAWRKAIEPSLKDLGYDIPPPQPGKP